MDDVKRTWLTYVQPYHEAIQATRRGTVAHIQHAAAMAERPRDPEVWAEWGRETARRHCLHDCLNISAAVDLDHRHHLLLYPEGEWQQVSMAVQEAALAELVRLWPALWRMRTALPTITGAFSASVDLADDLSELDRVGGRINANPPAALRTDGRYLHIEVRSRA